MKRGPLHRISWFTSPPHDVYRMSPQFLEIVLNFRWVSFSKTDFGKCHTVMSDDVNSSWFTYYSDYFAIHFYSFWLPSSSNVFYPHWSTRAKKVLID